MSLNIDGGFAVIPHYFSRHKPAFSPYAQLVFMHLVDRMNADGTCTPSIALLCEECGGIGRSSVIRALNELVEANLVEKYHRTVAKTHGQTSNLYKVNITEASKSSAQDSSGEHPAFITDTTPVPSRHTGDVHTVHERDSFEGDPFKEITPIAPNGGDSDTTPEDSETDNQTDEQSALFDAPTEPEHKPKHQASTGYTDDFEAFWAIYPLKLDKRTAFKAFRSALKRVTLDEIMTGARKYATDPNLPEPRYIKHASTWLNGDGWDNPPLPSSKTVSGRPNRAESRFNDAVRMAKELYAAEHGGSMEGMEIGR